MQINARPLYALILLVTVSFLAYAYYHFPSTQLIALDMPEQNSEFRFWYQAFGCLSVAPGSVFARHRLSDCHNLSGSLSVLHLLLYSCPLSALAAITAQS